MGNIVEVSEVENHMSNKVMKRLRDKHNKKNIKLVK